MSRLLNILILISIYMYAMNQISSKKRQCTDCGNYYDESEFLIEDWVHPEESYISQTYCRECE